jgi:GntR family transcriptional regulator, arabinose operon transcriptional repressor
MTPSLLVGGRECTRVAESLREMIGNGAFERGQYLPPLRELSRQFEVAGETARKALKQLEREGLLRAEARHGYRVMDQRKQEREGFPVAMISESDDPHGASSSTQSIAHAFQKAGSAAGFPVLGMYTGLQPDVDKVVKQLTASRTCGVLTDTSSLELVRRIRGMGLPVVMVNSWEEVERVDVVQQDNYRGAFLGAREVAQLGSKRVAWIGHKVRSAHGRERYAGAVAGLASMGLELDSNLCVRTTLSEAEEDIAALLSRKDRPDAILAYWRNLAIDACRASKKLGLQVGRDVHIVGWTAEEIVEESYDPHFPEDSTPPVILWKADAMATAALTRVEELMDNPRLPPKRILVDTWLRK